jgi:hypothetical protein
MNRIYKVGILHARVSRNPVEHVETRSISNYRPIVITPDQTLATLRALLNPLHHTLVLTCAATALRASEILALRWADILWDEERIRVSKRWAGGKEGPTKTRHRTVTFPCTEFWLSTCASGGNNRPTPRTQILFSRPPRRTAVFPYALAYSLLITCGQPQFGPALVFNPDSGLAFTTCVTV